MSNRLNQMSAPVAAVVVVLAMLGGAGIGLAAANLADGEEGGAQVVVAGPPDAGADPNRPTTTSPDAATPAPTPSAAPGAPAPPEGQVIAPDDAGEIAADHVGGGAVQAIEREDDYGATWEVEVYGPGGEYEVYVAASGTVVRVLGPFAD